MDFEYIDIENVKPGMLINHTVVKNEDALNLIVLSCVQENEEMWKIDSVSEDGAKFSIIINNFMNQGKVRVYSQDNE